MKNTLKYSIISTVLTCSAQASIVLADILGTDNMPTLADGSNFQQSSFNFTSDGQTATYLFAPIDDDTVDWDFNPTATITDNNPQGVIGSQITFTITNVTLAAGTTSYDIQFDPVAAGFGAPGARTSNLELSAGIISFDVEVNYLNSTGGALGVSGANLTANNLSTPMFGAVDNTGEVLNAAVSVLDGNFDVITGLDYIGADIDENSTNTTNSANGVVLFNNISNGNAFDSIHRFDDGTSSLAGGQGGVNRADDIFSGFFVSFDTTNTDGFDDGDIIGFSLDGRIIAPINVPEPSSLALLGFGTLAFVGRRKRS